MSGKGLRLYKREKLCSVSAIDRLFASKTVRDSESADSFGRLGFALCYPLRMVFGENVHRGGGPVQFLISVPKKRLRHAVDRVAMRRRIREAYRLERGDIAVAESASAGPRVDVAFIYVADKKVDSRRIRSAMRRLLSHLRSASKQWDDTTSANPS